MNRPVPTPRATDEPIGKQNAYGNRPPPTTQFSRRKISPPCSRKASRGKEMRQGELITAEVTRVDYNIVVVNAGLKSESFIPIEEFKNDKGEVEVKAGDFVTVAIEASRTATARRACRATRPSVSQAWHDLEAALEQGTWSAGLVTGKVKGGLTVMVNGIRAFLPGSLVDIRPVKDTMPFEGKAARVQGHQARPQAQQRRRVAPRGARSEPRRGARGAARRRLQEGAIVKGIVKNITDYGAFVDLGGIDGLLHITDLAWRRVKHPSEVLAVGDEVDAPRCSSSTRRRTACRWA